MQVTSAQLDDCLAIAEVHVASWQAAYAGIFPAQYLASLSAAKRAEQWRTIMLAGESRTFVARVGNTVIGFISLGRRRDAESPKSRGEVWALYVAPAAWSMGAGSALWEAGRVQRLHLGYSEVSLWVLSRNSRGIRFYEAVGFRRELGTEQSFERGGATLEEVRFLFEHMSANPSIEATAKSWPRYSAASSSLPRGQLSSAPHVER